MLSCVAFAFGVVPTCSCGVRRKCGLAADCQSTQTRHQLGKHMSCVRCHLPPPPCAPRCFLVALQGSVFYPHPHLFSVCFFFAYHPNRTQAMRCVCVREQIHRSRRFISALLSSDSLLPLVFCLCCC